MTKLLEKIFSVKNSNNRTHKIITIAGIKIKFKKYIKKLWNDPMDIVIDTTLLCNNNCSFCWRSNYPEYLKAKNQEIKQKTMPFKIYKKIIDDVCQYDSVKRLSLCGPMGEPLMNDRIEDFYEYAFKKHHFNILCINTNGLAINKRNYGKLLNSMHEFSISVDSIIPESYEKIHGHKHLDVVIENIRKCVEFKKKYGAVAKIVVRFTENKHNIGQIDEFIKFFKELGVDEINYTKEHSFAGVNSSLNSLETNKMCNQPYKIINFNLFGELTTCCVNWHLSPVFGNIKNHSLKQLWESKEKLDWNKNCLNDENLCKNCSGLGMSQHSQFINLKEDITHE